VSSSGTTVSDLAAYRGIKATQSGGASFGVTIGAGVTDRMFYVRAPAGNDLPFDVVRGTANHEVLPGQTVWFRVTGGDPNRLEAWPGGALSVTYQSLPTLPGPIDGSEAIRVLGGLGYAATDLGSIALRLSSVLPSNWGTAASEVLAWNDYEEALAWLALVPGTDVQEHSSRLDLLAAAPVALADGATIATEAALSTTFTVTLAGNRTLAAPTGGVAGTAYRWVIRQDGTGGRTLAFDSAFKFPGGTDSTLSTAADAIDVLVCLYDGTRWLCDLGGKGFA
jgi:hypothetical protein